MVAVGVTVVGCAVEPAGGRVLEIDRVEDGVVHAVDRESGRALVVKRTALPPRIREGDVVVDGRADPALAAELRAEVARARAALGPPRRGSLDLDDNPRLTHPREP